jgi:hypothetical protein
MSEDHAITGTSEGAHGVGVGRVADRDSDFLEVFPLLPSAPNYPVQGHVQWAAADRTHISVNYLVLDEAAYCQFSGTIVNG